MERGVRLISLLTICLQVILARSPPIVSVGASTNAPTQNAGPTGSTHPPLHHTHAETTRTTHGPLHHALFAVCPKGYTSYYGFCYLNIAAQMTFTDAEMFCKMLGGGHLLFIDSQLEASFISAFSREHIRKASKGILLDGTDVAQKGHWVHYSSLQPVGYFSWHPGQPPASHPSEHCLSMSEGNFMQVRSCADKDYFVCKKRATFKELSFFGSINNVHLGQPNGV